MVTQRVNIRFPADFVWGTATSSYQIEGAVDEDGRSESIWDRFCATPGKVRNGESGAIACDHYHRYVEDVALMRDLGLNAYRFSIAWPRVIPDGYGPVNERGLDFYDRLVDELLRSGIEPFVTLYHWDLPQVQEDRGGWLSRDTVDAFAAYTEAVARRLGDRVRHWITHNEPWCTSWLGYGGGHHAPGRNGGERAALVAAHHLLLSHGKAVEVIRSNTSNSQVGITLNLTPFYPATSTDEDMAAASYSDGVSNRWFLDPVFRASYPADMLEIFQGFEPSIQVGDMETIAQPLDFLGVNYYSRGVVRADPTGRRKAVQVRPEGSKYTDTDWEVYPEGLYDLIRRVHADYAPRQIYITENGAAYPDVRTHDGAVRDPERQQYIEQHIAQLRRIIDAGVPLAGYFIWSLLDNFEWGHGYWKRFGIVHVDYPTQERTPKMSYYWYQSFIAEQMAAKTTPLRSE
jgi:beta-glucosidase